MSLDEYLSHAARKQMQYLKDEVASLRARLAALLDVLEGEHPTETWRDVTAECEWCDTGFANNFQDPSAIMRGGERIGSCVFVMESRGESYRLRKVQPEGEDGGPHVTPKWAFIIEKLERSST